MRRDEVNRNTLDRLLEELHYAGSGLHKKCPADYGFHPPANPRPNKSLCDGTGLILRLAEAKALFRKGLERGMISRTDHDGYPKYVWAVGADERVYESKREGRYCTYHGYELGKDDESMRQLVLKEWHLRCKPD